MKYNQKIVNYALDYICNGKMALETIPKKYIRDTFKMRDLMLNYADSKNISVNKINIYEFSKELKKQDQARQEYLSEVNARLDRAINNEGEAVRLF